ncbi:hypothetical protein J2W23_006258, partial [Variovorax boronicumulans]|uniref:ESPR-type extended signal peptide-containing protein n=1 Tax=Variovorax boronicumulans TaxID=436515 RepID=UPI00277D8B95
MNKSYKSIWNEALGAWVAVSELAAGKGKSKNVERPRKGVFPFGFRMDAVSVAIMLFVSGMTGDANAAIVGVQFPEGTATGCLSGASGVVYRTNPGPTNLAGMTAGGVQVGSGSGTYGWVSGCAAIASGTGYVALGSFANAGSFRGVTAIGNQATTAANFATAVGAESLASGVGSSAFGTGSIASGQNSISIGGGGASILSAADSTRATADGAIAIGINNVKGAQALAANSVALGGSALATGSGALAIGRDANAAYADSVALGAGSVTGATGPTGASFLTGKNAPASEVSVGSTSAQRRLTNVSDGAAPQDAATVAQVSTAVSTATSSIDSLSTSTSSGLSTATSGISSLSTG